MTFFNKQLILYIFLLTSTIIVTSRIATFLHEVGGHALTAICYGESIDTISISLFGGGYVNVSLSNIESTSAHILFSLSGIIVNIVTGLIPLIFWKKIIKFKFLWSVNLIIFSIISLCGSLAYLIMGLYYEYGDPVHWTNTPPQWYLNLWWFFMCLAPIVTFVLTKFYFSVQNMIFQTSNYRQKVIVTTVSLGLSTLIYSGLFMITQQNIASVSAPTQYQEKAYEKLKEQQYQKAYQKIKSEHPDWSDKKIQDTINLNDISVELDDIPSVFPIWPILLSLFVLGGLIGLKQKHIESQRNLKLTTMCYEIFVYLAFTLALITLLFMLDSIIYSTKLNHNNSLEKGTSNKTY